MPNQIKRDPSQTTMIRNRFVVDMNQRFRAIKTAIRGLVVTDDAFGLVTSTPLAINVEKQVWRFRTNPDKVTEFRKWLTTQVDEKVLTTVTPSGKPWLSKYIESSYKKAQVRAYKDVYGELVDTPAGLKLTDDGRALGLSFAGPEETKRIEAIYSRAWNDVKGVTDTMHQKVSRTLSLGLANGQNPLTIARAMVKEIDGLERTRARVIARTEVIAAHAEGQLDAYDDLGIEKVTIIAEWQTAGDNRVCPECGLMEGTEMSIEEARGLIPRHPLCRCAWAPLTQRSMSKREAKGNIEKSILAEKPQRKKETKEEWATRVLDPKRLPEAMKKSTWAGKERLGKGSIKRVEKTIVKLSPTPVRPTPVRPTPKPPVVQPGRVIKGGEIIPKSPQQGAAELSKKLEAARAGRKKAEALLVESRKNVDAIKAELKSTQKATQAQKDEITGLKRQIKEKDAAIKKIDRKLAKEDRLADK